MLGQRLLSAVVAIPLVVLFVRWAPPWLFLGLVLLLALRVQWELYRMFAGVGVAAAAGPGLLLGGLVVVAFSLGDARPWGPVLALSLAVGGCLVLGLGRAAENGPDWAGSALTLLGVCYGAWLLAHAVWLRALPHGEALVLFVLGVTWCGESAAYLVGRRWGRHKLAPRVSPAKTVEGAVAQLVASAGAALLAAWAWAVVSPLHGLGLGLVLGVVGQLGDLVESFLKRSAAVKDAGGLIPGHGGLLDRLDSLLFNVPGLYYYVKLFGDG